MLSRLLAAALALAVVSLPGPAADPPKRVLLVGSPPDGHPPETHEYMAGANVLAKLLKPVRGVTRGGRCVRPRGRRTGGTSCTRYVRVGSFRRRDRAGANRFRFTGRLR